MLNKVLLYYNTLQNMKLSQIYSRIKIKLGGSCGIGVRVSENYAETLHSLAIPELDFDPVFIARFPAEELMSDKITILHSSKDFDWKSHWNFEDMSALWNFNLHYFEYLFPLVKAWKDSGDNNYLEKTFEIISGWINCNPIGENPAWASYPVSLRIINWINYYGYTAENMPDEFRKTFLESLHSQYAYLSRHLEKDLLGNHYFEDLKSLVFAAIFFKDEAAFNRILPVFKAECKEEILPDGMHFELSPMYHKIIFEGMLRVALALRKAGKPDSEIESYLQPMLDVAYSFEEGLERVPLFNDGGNNVAKNLDALLITADRYLGLKPCLRNRLESSGFYIFKRETNGHTWKLIVDAGQPGPEYIPGHAHCDAMSYELFRDGKPVVVNCGTYAYQCKERNFFRSTAAHNTVMIDGVEQSQFWGEFRLAKRSSIKVLKVTDNSILMALTNQKGKKAEREIVFSDKLTVTDRSYGHGLRSYIHLAEEISVSHNAEETILKQDYAADFGGKRNITVKEFNGKDVIETDRKSVV